MKKNLIYIYFLLSLVFPSIGLSKTTPIQLKQSTFAQLPGWNQAKQLKQSFEAFQSSCKVILKLKPNHSLGSNYFNLTAKDWYPACRAATGIKNPEPKKVKNFFTTWFKPFAFHQKKPIQGKFTAYYLPTIKGSRIKTAKYTVPIYGVPSDLVVISKEGKKTRIGRKKNNTLLPYYTRQEINNGAIKKTAPVLAWVESPLDRLSLETEGSGIIEFDNKKKIYLNYASSNGRIYSALPNILESRGIMSKKNASRDNIKKYFLKNPKQLNPILNRTQSFVFFLQAKEEGAFGALHALLTPGYSLAVDPKWVPFGTPIWINTKKVDYASKSKKTFQRIMIAQDTGIAIKGPVRADLYWGSGKEAIYLGHHMTSSGEYWLLIPKNTLSRLQKKL